MSQTITSTTEPAETPVLAPPLIVLIIISALGPIALNICMPSMPGMQKAFDTSYAMVQLSLTFYLIAMAISQIVFGPLSDRFGRRPLLIAGLSLFIVGSVFAALAPTIETLIAARFFQGLGGAAGLAIGRAIIRDCYSRGRSASMIGYVTMGMVVGPMVSPLAGGLLDESFGWHASFVAVVVVALPVLLIVLATLHETNTQRESGAVFQPIVDGAFVLFRSSAFWCYALTLGFASAAFFSFLAAAPHLAVEVMGMSPSDYGLYFPLGAIGYMVGNFLTGQYSERIGPTPMIIAGSIMGLVATFVMVALAMTGTIHPLALFVPMAFTALSNGLVLPNAIANCVSVRPDLAGAAAGLSGAIQLGIGAGATVLTGLVDQTGLLPLALIMFGSILMATIFAFLGRGRLAA
ncbi:multidrug effflux MFS transporter [Tepidamorphus sp. 3E244]|uniref:multidrug effflux MFS transporter n=1 Tax=Tepidamorphus sp. 3E244 TaxID=3385498 RepID=UPI0038FC19E9